MSITGMPSGDADDQSDARIGCFEDRVSGERRGNEDGGNRRSGFPDRVAHAIENRNAVLERLSPLARSDSGDHLGPVIEAELGVAASVAARVMPWMRILLFSSTRMAMGLRR